MLKWFSVVDGYFAFSSKVKERIKVEYISSITDSKSVI